MRKLVAILVIALFAFSSLSAEAAVGIKKDGVYQGAATNLDFKTSAASLSGNTVTVYATGHKSGVTADPTTGTNLNAASLAYGVILVDSGSARVITIADGAIGQMITFICNSADGKTYIISDDSAAEGAITNTGWDDISFDAVGESVTLLFLDATYGWIIIGYSGVTIT